MPRWRVVAPRITYQTTDRTPAEAFQGELVRDVHPAFARALEGVRAIVRVSQPSKRSEVGP